MAVDQRTALDKDVAASRAAGISRRRADISAQAISGQSWELPHAVLREVSVNGIGWQQRQSETEPGQPSMDDPIEWRDGAWANPLGRLKWYISKTSTDVMRWIDGRLHLTEIFFFKRAIDELFDGDGKPMPLAALYMTSDAHSSNDADMQPVIIATRTGLRILVPVYFESGVVGMGSAPPGIDGHPHAMWAPNGLWVTQQQDDGNFLTYELARAFDVGRFRAVWSRSGGDIPIDQQQWVGQ